jgi:hypothetical protein
MKPQYHICPDCGASLDPQERCSCHEENEVVRLQAALEKKSEVLQAQIMAEIRKDARIRELVKELEGVK